MCSINKSIEYICNRLGQNKDLTHIPFKSLLKRDIPGDIPLAFWKGTSKPLAVLRYNSSANFNYFITDSFYSDGTLLFTWDACRRIIEKICRLETCYGPASVEIEEENSLIYYEVGDFVIERFMLNESPDPKRPWLLEKTIVRLPVKFYVDNTVLAKGEK